MWFSSLGPWVRRQICELRLTHRAKWLIFSREIRVVARLFFLRCLTRQIYPLVNTESGSLFICRVISSQRGVETCFVSRASYMANLPRNSTIVGSPSS